jgi:hypothetical protein
MDMNLDLNQKLFRVVVGREVHRIYGVTIHEEGEALVIRDRDGRQTNKFRRWDSYTVH